MLPFVFKLIVIKMPELTNSELLITKILSPVLAKMNIGDYHLDLNDCTGKGEGYLGKIWRAKVQQTNREINLIVKLASEEEEHRNFLKIPLLYKNEVYFYNDVFPILDKFQKGKNVKQPSETAKYYGASITNKEEAIILEDLKTEGFVLHDRKKPLDEEHISFVFAQYGKFHAISFALRDQQPDVFKKTTIDLVDVFPIVFPSVLDSIITHILCNADMLQQQGLKAESQLAKKVAEQMKEIIGMKCAPDDPYTVVTHGDCWSNNMMFKYDVSVFNLINYIKSYKSFFQDKTKKLVDHRMIDFQLARVHSPIFDLAYFFYASAPKRVMDQVDKYLKIYHDSLSDFMRQLGSDPKKVFPFDVFLNEWKKYRKFGLAMALFLFRFSLAEADEAVSVSTKENFADGFAKEMTNQGEHNRRVTEVVKHFVESNGAW